MERVRKEREENHRGENGGGEGGMALEKRGGREEKNENMEDYFRGKGEGEGEGGSKKKRKRDRNRIFFVGVRAKSGVLVCCGVSAG